MYHTPWDDENQVWSKRQKRDAAQKNKSGGVTEQGIRTGFRAAP
jgi:hypothetical protein